MATDFNNKNATDMANMFVNTYMLTWENIITTNCSRTTIAQIKEAFEADN